MKNLINIIAFCAALLVTIFILQSCKKTSLSSDTKDVKRGMPLILAETPEYDKESQTFVLKLHADSVADAEVTYYLLDGDSILMQNNDGRFMGVLPLEEGYNVKAKVEWSDTIVVTPIVHVVGFIIPREPVEKLSEEALKKLFDAKDETTIDKYLVQGVKLVVQQSQVPPTLVHDVFVNLKNQVWKSVTVKDVQYDDYNFITSITLIPVGENVEPVVDDDENGVFYDEY